MPLAAATGALPALLLVQLLQVGDGFPVRCAKGCTDGVHGCHNVCTGEQKQVHSCPRKASCPSRRSSQCPPGAVPQHCEFSEWSEWVSAGCSGLCSRNRTVKRPNSCGGSPCEGPLQDSKSCPESCKSLSQDCQLSDWTAWGLCGATQPNQQERTRKVLSAASPGKSCGGSLMETQVCGSQVAASSPCEVSDWYPWGPCTQACGGGTRTRLRVIASKAQSGGAPCNTPLQEVEPCGTAPCANGGTDCKLGAWSDWSSCEDAPTMQRLRRRSILTPATAGGDVCTEPLEEMQPCSEVSADGPVNCELGDWGAWTLCDRDCDGGQTYRLRSVARPASRGGRPCTGDLKQTRECNKVSCADVQGTPCRAALWSDWGACSTSCGAGQQQRSRGILAEATGGGRGCDMALSEVRACAGAAACPSQNCTWAQWSTWTPCSATCGGGQTERTRGIVTPASGGGATCDALDGKEVKTCGATSCTPQPVCVNGLWSQWSQWSQCSASCAGGYRVRSRRVEQEANECGTPAEGLGTQVESCSGQVECVQDADCTLSEWGDWGACSSDCSGVRERDRTVLTHRQGNGALCPSVPLREVESCGSFGSPGCADAPRDCKLGDWQAWSTCSAKCGGGQKSRLRQVLQTATRGGKACTGELSETEGCAETSCGEKVDCVWSAWSAWGNCTKCGGQQFRSRTILTPPQHGGKACEGPASETTSCPRDCGSKRFYCVAQAWGAWGPCSATCGTGTRKRSRTLAFSDSAVGAVSSAVTPADCQGGQEEEVGSCEAAQATCEACVPQDCSLSQWSEWKSELPCEGLCSRVRSVAAGANECGAPCKGSLTENKRCPQTCEAQDCKLSGWSAWTTCSSSSGQKYQTRSIAQQPAFESQGCYGVLQLTAPCATGASAAVDCKMQDWSDWGTCDKTCGGGQRSRTRSVVSEATNGGMPCEDALVEVASCGMDACEGGQAEDCSLSQWTEWSSCTVPQNQQVFRYRRVLHAAMAGGQACQGELNQTKQCVAQAATSRDCEFDQWGAWTECTATCNGGQHMRAREVKQWAQEGGAQCVGATVQTQPCGLAACAPNQDCQLAQWSSWSPCSVSCGDGYRTRHRSILKGADPGGKPCVDSLQDFGSCNDGQCPGLQDCMWYDWAPWSACEPALGPCGTGYKWRNRDVYMYPKNGGALCKPRIKEEVVPVENCRGQPKCCVDGEWADWGAWGACTATCGTGTKSRSRALAVEATWCGMPAVGDDKESAMCDAGPCDLAVDCKWSDWTATGACSSRCHGHAEKRRFVEKNASAAGKPCEGPDTVLEACNPPEGQADPYSCQDEKKKAPVDCVLSQWNEWTSCSATCEKGARTRSRSVLTAPKHGGKMCATELSIVEVCHADVACDPDKTNCAWSEWAQWGVCDTTSGTRTRTRGFAVQASKGGLPCVGGQEETASCANSCAVEVFNCGWEEWTQWSACPDDCSADAERTRTRSLGVGAHPEAASAYGDSFLQASSEGPEQLFSAPAASAAAPAETAAVEELVAAGLLGAVCCALAVAVVRVALPSLRSSVRYAAVSQG